MLFKYVIYVYHIINYSADKQQISNSKNMKIVMTVEDLQEFNNNSYDQEFEIRKFQRKYRKFFKFSIVSNYLFSIKSKITGTHCMIWILENHYLEIRHTNSKHLYTLKVSTSKTLIEKLIKHNLI